MAKKKTCRHCKQMVTDNHRCPVKGEVVNYRDNDDFFPTAATMGMLSGDSPSSTCGDPGGFDSGGCDGGGGGGD